MALQDRDYNRTPNNSTSVPATWTSREAYLLAAICLIAGIALGYLFHGSSSPIGKTDGSSAAADASNAMAAATAPPGMGSASGAQMPSMEQIQRMTAALEERVKNNPADVDALVQLGNLYMDHGQYQQAIGYYQNALKLQPKDPNVRTDLGTCYFNTGDSKRALAEFDTVLKENPNYAQTLFNVGVVQSQGLQNYKAAIEAWQKLLDTNPNYEHRDKVQQMIAEAKSKMGK